MPGGDGRGPLGRGPGTGRGMGRGRGGMDGGRFGAGPGGNCVCPSCGTKAAHQPGTPCALMNCPKCGIRMVRE